jgi:hypothetical protein
MTMPDAVLRSSSSRLTMTRSCNGRICMFSFSCFKKSKRRNLGQTVLTA